MRSLIRSSASEWAGTNLEEASSWLDSLPASPLRDSAVAGFSSKVADANPPVALEWAATIADPDLAAKQRSGILRRWKAKDPEAAEAWKSENQ